MERYNNHRKKIFDLVKKINNETNNLALIEDVLNNDNIEMPASLYGERFNHSNDLDETMIKNPIDGKTWIE